MADKQSRKILGPILDRVNRNLREKGLDVLREAEGGTPQPVQRHRILIAFADGSKAYYTGKKKHDIGFRECWSPHKAEAKLYVRVRTARDLARVIRLADVKCCVGEGDVVEVETFIRIVGV